MVLMLFKVTLTTACLVRLIVSLRLHSESEEGGLDEEADRRAMSAIVQALLGSKHSLQGGSHLQQILRSHMLRSQQHHRRCVFIMPCV